MTELVERLTLSDLKELSQLQDRNIFSIVLSSKRCTIFIIVEALKKSPSSHLLSLLINTKPGIHGGATYSGNTC